MENLRLVLGKIPLYTKEMSPAELKKLAKQAISQLSNRNTSPQILDAYLNVHSDCFTWNETCELCEYFGESPLYGDGSEFGAEYLLLAAAENPSLSPPQQEQILTFLYEYFQEEISRLPVLAKFAANPNVSDEVKQGYLLQASTYQCFSEETPEDNRETERESVIEMLAILQRNARFTPHEIKKFKAEVFNELGIKL